MSINTKTPCKKVKDLPGTASLGGIKVKTSDGLIGFWSSQWGAPGMKSGVWLSRTRGGGGQVYPIQLNSLNDALDWDIANDDEEVNL